MRAYVMTGPGAGAVEDLPDARMGDFDAAVDILWCGVCSSTDRMLRQGTFRGGVSYPSILGHESVGRVTAVGSGVENVAVGDLVTRPAAYRATDAPVRMHWGGFATRGLVTDLRAQAAAAGTDGPPPAVPWTRLDGRTDPQAAALAISLSETFSVACREDLVGKTVAVVGTGIAGLSLMRFARLFGAARVIGVGRRPSRLEQATLSGATETFLAATATDALASDRVDVVFDASGQASMIDQEFRWLRDGGRLVVFSAPEDPAALDIMAAPRDATLRVASTHETAVLPDVVRLVETGFLPLDRYVTHRGDLESIEDTFATTDDSGAVKALVRMS